MSTPDIRVRLSPEGVQEVIAGLRKVQAEGARANRSAAQGTGLVANALREVKALLPTLGVAAVVGGFVGLARGAYNSAEAMARLQVKVGGTAEELSALTSTFRDNELDQATLQKALTKTQVLLDDLRNGSTSAAAKVEALGLSARDLQGLSTPRALEKLSQALARIPADRTAKGVEIFGREAADLIPALVAVGREGLDPLIAKLAKTGKLLDQDLVDAAAAADDAMDALRNQAEGIGNQFAAGFAPQATAALEQISSALTGDGINSMRKFGEVVGFTLRFVITLFQMAGREIGARAAELAARFRGLGDAAGALARGDLAGIRAAFQRSRREVDSIRAELAADQRALLDKLATPPGPRERGKREDGGRSEEVAEEARRLAAARAAASKQARTAELAVSKAADKAELDAAKEAHEQGLLALADYFTRRRAIIARQGAQELALLRAERSELAARLAVEAGPGSTEDARIKLRGELAAINAQIRAKEIEGRAELAALDAEEAAAARRLGEERLSIAGQLADAENDRHAAFMLNIADEIQRIRLLGAQAGQSVEEIESTVSRLMAARTAGFNLEDAQRRGSAALEKFDRDAARIQRDQESGILSQVEAQQRLLQLQTAALPVLRALADETLRAAQATGGADAIQRAQDFADSIDQIAASYRAATDVGARFRQGAIESFQTGGQTLLQNAQQIESVGDIFKSLARTIVESLQRIAAEILAQQATFALLRLFGIGGAAAPRAQTGGVVVQKKAAGDVIAGPQLRIPGPDKVPILGQVGEFIVRRARVMQPGGLQLLRAFNDGRVSAAQLMRWPRFAEGGTVGAAPVSPTATSNAESGPRIINLLDPSLVSQYLATADGERAVVNIITRNRDKLRALQGF